MRIVDGKFYKNNVEVKPEFGNIEQIRALQQALQQANKNTVEAKLIQEEKVLYYASVRFKCPICQQDNEVEVLEDDPSEWRIDNSDVNGYDITCTNSKCETEFTIEQDKTSKGNMGIVLTYDNPD
jgi:hypothetical protein